MQRPRIRLEIRGIMAAVAVSALILCVYRVDVAPSVSVVLILGSASALAYKRYSDGLAQRVKAAQSTTRSQKITLLITSVVVAVTLIGLSDGAFLGGYYGYVEVLYPLSTGYETDIVVPRLQVLLTGVFCGFMMAMIVAFALRRKIWPIVDEPLKPASSPPEV